MKKRPLTFDHVPVVGGVVGRQGLRRPSDEIGDHRVHGDTSTSNHDAGLPGGAKGGRHATGRQGTGQGQRRVFLAQRAVRADRQHPLTAALAPRTGGKHLVGMPHIVQLAATALRSLHQGGE